MIYHDKQLIHVHPPKTGGQAIQQALGVDPLVAWHNGIWRHASLEDMYAKCPESREYRVAISVRNPYERLLSFYYYVVFARGLIDDPTAKYLRGFEDATDFVRYADFDYVRIISEGEAVLRPQHWYLDGHTPDVVWRLEDVGPLLPVVNKVFDHHTWSDIMSKDTWKNKSLWRFVNEDKSRFY